MTFGKQGWLTRLDYMEQNNDLYIDRFPVSDIPEVWDEIDFYLDYVEGLRQSVENLDQAKPDVDKWLPGYKQFWEWVGNEENDYWTKIEEGLISPSTFASEWETQINQMIEDALNQADE
jgi:multiple sugar transport system substrate-binding protein